MPSSDPRRRFRDVVDNCDRIAAYVAGFDLARFRNDARTVDAVKLQPRAAEFLPGHDWDAMRGFGDVLRHDYDRIDEAMIWEVATDHLPRLRADRLAAIAALDAGEGSAP